jgi:hypothetical protein
MATYCELQVWIKMVSFVVMNQIKTLYVTDLDGTLLGADSRISATSVAILNELIDAGVMITPATARTPATVQPMFAGVKQSVYVDKNGENQPLPTIVMTGGALWNRQTQTFEHCTLIDEAEADAILATFRRVGLSPFIYCLSGKSFLSVYHPSTMTVCEDEFYQERKHLELKRFNLDQMPERLDSVVLFFAIGEVTMVERAVAELRSVTQCAAAWYPDIHNSNIGLIDLYAPGVSKAKAVADLARRVGAERTVVFGDNLNDLPMMRVADVAIAVENALPQVKAEAHRVIGLNTADAVAKCIAEMEFDNLKTT